MAVLGKEAVTGEKPPRERILEAARALFYGHGIRAVSVDEIAAAARTNKMTLYRHFGSKDLLVTEYLRTLSDEADRVWDSLALVHPRDPIARLEGWVAHISSALADAGNRGCAIANAAIEIPEKDHPARAVIERHKTHQRDQLAGLCRQAHFSDAGCVADEIFLLLEGARVSVQSVGRTGPGGRFHKMVCALLKSSPRKKA